MKKITLFMTMFIAATMSIFAQNANELRLLNTRPSSNGEEIEGIATSWEFIFSENAKVADNAVKELEIKNEANEVIACVGLTGVGTYENSIFTGIVANDTIWSEYYDDVTGETIKYVSGLIYPTGLDVPGIYTMTIPAGTFVSAQDNNIAIAETTLTFNVIAPKPKWSTDYDYTTTVKEFETITISFENVKEVKLNEGVLPMLYTAAGAEYTGKAELVEEVDEKEGKTTYSIKVSFGEEKFSEEDTYYIIIPEGMFTMNNEVSNEEKQITLEILAPVEVTALAIESITPKFGENGEFLEVWIAYNQQVYFGNQDWMNYVVNLTDADGNQYPMWPKDPYDPAQGWALVIPGNTVVLMPVKLNEEGLPYEYNEYGQVLTSPITTQGQYTLNLADVTVRYGYDAVAYQYSAIGSYAGTEVITIEEDTAVEGIEAEAENAEIYDLTGRRVEKITNAGIYIVNGVKKVIK